MDGFVRRRVEGVLDNVIAQVVLWSAVFGAPIVLGIILQLGTVATALMMILVSEMAIIALLLWIRAGLSRQKVSEEPLARDSRSGGIYLMDRFGLPRAVTDDDTSLYLAEILGYEAEDVPTVSPGSLHPLGPEVKAIRAWAKPRTKRDRIWAEAHRSLRLLGKRIDAVAERSILRMRIRNDGDHDIEIQRVDLIVDGGAPLLMADVAPEHKPQFVGYSTCRPLFGGQTVSERLAPEQESTLEVRLQRQLSREERDRIVGVKIGHLVLSCLLHDSQVSIHMDT